MDPTYIIQFPEASVAGADKGWSDAALVSVSVVIGIGVGLLVVVCIHYVRKRDEGLRFRRCCSCSFRPKRHFPERLVFTRTPIAFKHSPIDETFDYDNEPEYARPSQRDDNSNTLSQEDNAKYIEYSHNSLSKMLSTASTLSNAFRGYACIKTRMTCRRASESDGSGSISSISSDSDSVYDPIDQEDIMYSSSRTGLQLDFDMNDRRDSWYDCLSPSTQASSSNDTNVRSPSSVLQFSSLFSSHDMPRTSLWCKDDECQESRAFGKDEEEFMVFPSEVETRNNFYQEHGISSSITTSCQSLFKGSLSFLSFSTTYNESDSESTPDICVALDDAILPTFARTWNEPVNVSIV